MTTSSRGRYKAPEVRAPVLQKSELVKHLTGTVGELGGKARSGKSDLKSHFHFQKVGWGT